MPRPTPPDPLLAARGAEEDLDEMAPAGRHGRLWMEKRFAVVMANAFWGKKKQ